MRKKDNIVAMPSAHLSSPSLPEDKLREDTNINGSFIKFEESKVDKSEVLKFKRIPAGISHAIGYADRQ